MNKDEILVFDNLSFRRLENTILNEVSVKFKKGDFSVIMGKSGCGKSTSLYLSVGLLEASKGNIYLDNKKIDSIYKRASKEKIEFLAKIGFLFQGGALLNEKTVMENVALPLYLHKPNYSNTKVRTIVEDMLKRVELPNVNNLMPSELSGGMIKRVALARALILEPKILFCDEPFSGLDPLLTIQLNSLLLNLSKQKEMSCILVSHNVGLALKTADSIYVLSDKKFIIGGANNQDNQKKCLEFFGIDEINYVE